MLVQPDCSSEWPDPQRPSKDFCDFIHGNIQVFYPINLLIDRKELQRLRHIKQMGVCNYVYHSATNDRFGHSMGAYHLAYLFATTLKANYGKNLNITSQDILCVSIGGLYHDTGHGAFSHLFEEVFPGRSHEDISVEIVHRVFNVDYIREAFTPYFGEGEQYERNVTFIAELIEPPKKLFDDQGNWLMKGRTADKGFLYEIVSNPLTGLDVDKFDYILRDSATCGCSIAFSLVDVNRIRGNLQVFADEEHPGHNRLCYNKKIVESIRMVGESRQTLHSKIYRHKTVTIVNEMMVRVIKKAGNFKVLDKQLKNVKESLEAYLRLDDSIINEIHRSTDEEFKECRELLDKLERRLFPKFLVSYNISPATVTKMERLHCVGPNAPRKLKTWIESQLPAGAIVLERDINRGDRSQNPLKKVFFYDTRNKNLKPYKLTDEEVLLNNPIYGAYHDFCVYADYDVQEEQQNAIRAKFMEIEQEIKALGTSD
ncbi:unnamed protein product [Auanema sp. JU1783]|nr:unnamed protein product [Auanema sp. JU1783]